MNKLLDNNKYELQNEKSIENIKKKLNILVNII